MNTNATTGTNILLGKKLFPGQRYLFTEICPNTFNETQYRATFKIVVEHFLVTIHSDKRVESFENIIFTPVQWIMKVESLDDILEGNTVLPEDVLFLIDNYV